jgi:hypothetical protein
MSIKSSHTTIRGGGANHPPSARPTIATRAGRVDHCVATERRRIHDSSCDRRHDSRRSLRCVCRDTERDNEVNDFALGPVTSLAQPATATPTLMLLGYFYRPYTANSFIGRFTYLW